VCCRGSQGPRCVSLGRIGSLKPRTAVDRNRRTYLLAAVETCQLPLAENGCALQHAEITEPRRVSKNKEASENLSCHDFRLFFLAMDAIAVA
jgi:hypothetical protein